MVDTEYDWVLLAKAQIVIGGAEYILEDLFEYSYDGKEKYYIVDKCRVHLNVCEILKIWITTIQRGIEKYENKPTSVNHHKLKNILGAWILWHDAMCQYLSFFQFKAKLTYFHKRNAKKIHSGSLLRKHFPQTPLEHKTPEDVLILMKDLLKGTITAKFYREAVPIYNRIEEMIQVIVD
jgi:hypothetical protein